MHLVEGGRWLLVVDRNDASISYYDLDAPVVTGRTLTPAVFNASSPEMLDTHFSIDEDCPSSTLSFNLALSAKQHPLTSFKVWRVELQLDHENVGVALTARCLASFQHHHEILRVNSLHLSRDRVFLRAYFEWRGLSPKMCMVLFDWEQANGQGSDYSIRFIDGFFRVVRLMAHWFLYPVSF